MTETKDMLLTPTMTMLFLSKKSGLILSFLFLFFIFLSSSAYVSANPDSIGYGNPAADYSGTTFDYTLFGSNFPSGNVNFTETILTQTMKYAPVVTDLDGSGQNEIYVLTSSAIYLISEQLEILDSVAVANIVTQPCVFNYNGDAYPEIAFISNSSGYYTYWMFNYYGEGLVYQKSYNFTISGTTLTSGLFCGVDHSVDDKLFIVANDGDVYNIEVATNTLDVTSDTPPATSGIYDTSDSVYGSSMTAGKFLSTGNTKILFYARPSGAYKLISYDTLTDKYSYYQSALTDGTKIFVKLAKIGSPSTESKILMYSNIPGSSVDRIEVINSDLTTSPFSLSHSGNPTSLTGFPIAVADIDKDSRNEMCICNGASFVCYDYSFTAVLTSTMPNGTSSCSGSIAIGEYSDDSDSYMELINNYGVWQINSSNVTDMDIIYHTELSTSSIGLYSPVSLISKTSYTKDLLFATNTSIQAFYSSGAPSVCPNEICESGENSFNCFQDCGIPGTNLSNEIGSLSIGHVCTEDSHCLSGICEFNICIGIAGGLPCTSDAQCISGVCDDTLLVCENADAVTGISSWLEMFGIRNTGSKLLFGLAFILIMTGVISTFGYGIAGLFGGIAGGLVGFFGSLVVSTIIFGWIGVWILFMFIFTMIIVMIVFAIIKTGV